MSSTITTTIRRRQDVPDLRRASVMWENVHTGPADIMLRRVASLRRTSSGNTTSTGTHTTANHDDDDDSSMEVVGMDISPPFNVKPGPSSHLNTDAPNMIRILPPATSPSQPPPPPQQEDVHYPRITIPITYPARRPLSALVEEDDDVDLEDEDLEEEIQFMASLRSYRRHSPQSVSLSDASTPELIFTADDLLNSALSHSSTTRRSFRDSRSSDYSEALRTPRDEQDFNALGLMMADGDTDEDERRAEFHVGFGTIPSGKELLSFPQPPARNSLRRQSKQIHSHSRSSSISRQPIPSAAHLLSVLHTPSIFGGTDLPAEERAGPARPRFQRGDPLPPMFIYGHLATPALLSLLASSRSSRLSIQPARLHPSTSSRTQYQLRSMSSLDWPVLVKSRVKSPPTSTSPSVEPVPIDGYLLHNLSTSERRRVKLLHPHFQAAPEGELVPLFHRTLVQVKTRDGHAVDATAFVWKDEAEELCGHRFPLVVPEAECQGKGLRQDQRPPAGGPVRFSKSKAAR